MRRFPVVRSLIPLFLALPIVAIACAIAAIGFIGTSGKPQVPEVSSPSPPPVRTRTELRTLLMGKTKDEVLAIIGRPHSTNGENWTYKKIAFDPIAGKVDDYTHIAFSNGKVIRIT